MNKPQHIENTWNTPYLFNAKELDEETGLYYQGMVGLRAEGKITTLPASYVPQIPLENR
ncbi:MAG: hypothetical protein ACK5MD_01245 [Flavobacteriales bacterium]